MCALQLERECKGITANYWRIKTLHFDADTNTTSITLALYESKRARNLGTNNDLDKTTMQFEGFCNQAECYAKIKESKLATREITPAVTTGSPMTGDYMVVTPAVTEQYEANEFATAIDV